MPGRWQQRVGQRAFIECISEAGGQDVLQAEVDFSISENPSLQFSLPGREGGVLTVVAQDSQGLRFEDHHQLDSNKVQKLAEGVYAVLGNPQQQQGNAGFIVGPRGLMVIDSGGSWREGQALLGTVRSVTSLPIQLLLLTHARAEFIFGAGAFQDQGIPVHMHADAAQLMTSRCATCLQQLKERLGNDAMANTRVPQADVLLTQTQTMKHTGRMVKVLAAGHSSSPGALAVLDEQSGVVFAGAWLEVQHLPDLRDAKLREWLSALEPWLKEDDQIWVPAHGPVVTGRAGQAMRHYLQALNVCVQDHVDHGTSLIEMDKACAQPGFASWANYDSQHPRNVVRLYLQLEREALLAPDASNP
jgi:glyoxylase-like metal-dependent hydrolase (beta-lactamase superfamily II)